MGCEDNKKTATRMDSHCVKQHEATGKHGSIPEYGLVDQGDQPFTGGLITKRKNCQRSGQDDSLLIGSKPVGNNRWRRH